MITIKYKHLIGIPFVHGSDDCYGLARRFYKDNFGLSLSDYARPDGWWDAGLNLYDENFRKEGFQPIDIELKDMEIGDAMLMAIRTEHACHCAMYIGDGMMLHHFIKRRSETTRIAGPWRNRTVAIIRHKDIVIEKPKPTRLNAMGFMLPHKRKLLEDALG